MQLPGQIVEEKKQQQHEMDAISNSVTISCFFFARARATLEISGVVVLVPHVRREKKTTNN